MEEKKLEKAFKTLSMMEKQEHPSFCQQISFGHSAMITVTRTGSLAKIVIENCRSVLADNFVIEKFNWHYEKRAVKMIEKYVAQFESTLKNMQLLFLKSKAAKEMASFKKSYKDLAGNSKFWNKYVFEELAPILFEESSEETKEEFFDKERLHQLEAFLDECCGAKWYEYY